MLALCFTGASMFMLAAWAGQAHAAGEMTLTPTTWDVIGLKSNNSGMDTSPELYPVGAKVCNTTGSTLSNVQTDFVWDSSNSYVDVSGPSNNKLGDVDPGQCVDSYYVVQLQKTSAAWNTFRGYHINASADGGAEGSSPIPRQLYVEKLNAQNRNIVHAISGPGGCNADYTVCDPAPTDLEVGKEYTYKVYAQTASSYEQLNAFMSFPGSLFHVKSISSQYQIPPGATVQGPYANACGWDPVPTSPTYKSCTGPILSPFQPDGKAGGTMVVTYKVTAADVGDGSLRGLIYDYSGASYHYNQDYPNVPINITIKYPLDVSIVGQGNVKTDVGNIDCGLGASDCHQIYKKDTVVVLTAQPGDGQEFLSWSGDGCSGTQLTCTVTMDQARKVVATFSDKKTGKLTVQKSLSPSDDPGLFDLLIDGKTKASGVGDGGTTGAQTVWEGQHTVSEQANAESSNPLSDYNSSLACSDGEDTVPSDGGKVDVGAGQEITCTWTNTRKTGTITISKKLVPFDDPGRFDLLLDGKVKADYVGDGGTTGKLTVPTGQHTLSEETNVSSPNPLSDYSSKLVCKDDQGTVDTTGNQVDISEGQNLDCIWTNTRKTGTLTVSKSLSPKDDPGLFDLTINGTVKASAVGDGGSTGPQTVKTGKQTISEDAASSSPVSLDQYTHSVACQDKEGPVPVTQAGELTVASEQDVTCVWTNTRKTGTLTVAKSLSPRDDPGLFDLKVNDQTLAKAVGDGGSTGSQTVPIGTQTISEDTASSSPVSLNQYNTSVACKDDQGPVEVTQAGILKVGENQNVVCTWTNVRKAGTITVDKSLSPKDDPGLFDLKIDGDTKASGVGDGGSTGAQYAVAGQHTVSEGANSNSPTGLSDYKSSLECKDQNESKVDVGTDGTIQIQDGEKVTCVFLNIRKAGTLTVNKSLSPKDDSGLFDLKINGQTLAKGVGDGGSTGSQYAPQGEYTLAEAANSESPTSLSDYNTKLACQDKEGAVQVNDDKVQVQDGQDVTCVFTNTRKAGTLTLTKSLSPKDDPGLFDLKINDQTLAKGVGDGGSTGSQYAPQGEYTLAEATNASSPTSLSDYNTKLSCQDDEGSVPVADDKVQVQDGQDVTCTWTNTRKAGTLTLDKSLSPKDDSGLFDLKINDQTLVKGVGDGGSTGSQYAPQGEYTLAEAANSESPTSLSDYNSKLTCQDKDGAVQVEEDKVQVQDGQDVTCTWTNTRKTGTITVNKILDPTSDPGLFDLKINDTAYANNVGNNGSTGPQQLPAGIYTISETAGSQSPTSLTDYNSKLACKDEQGTVDSSDGKVKLDDGQAITCTWANTRIQFPLTAKVVGNGSITSNPDGINCGVECNKDYNGGTEVTLTATPASGQRFVGWTGDCSGSATTCVVTMDQARNVVATFEPIPLLPLDVAIIGSGNVQSTPTGVSCPGTCNKDWEENTKVTLVAKPSAGWVFQGWTGDCTNVTGNCVVTMSQARSVVAVFGQVSPTRSFLLRTRIVGRGQGRVKSSPRGVNCIFACSKLYQEGQLVRLTQHPKRGYYFVRWSGSCHGRGRCLVRMNRTRTVYAFYRRIPKPRFTG